MRPIIRRGATPSARDTRPPGCVAATTTAVDANEMAANPPLYSHSVDRPTCDTSQPSTPSPTRPARSNQRVGRFGRRSMCQATIVPVSSSGARVNVL